MPVTSTPSDGFTVGVASSLTFAHTSDAYPLYVLLSWWVATGGTDATDVIDSVTYDGVELARGGRIAVAGNTMEWWRLSAPTVGTADVEVTLNSSRKIAAGALNLSGWPTLIADHTFDAEGDDTTPPAVVVGSRVGAEVISWIGFNHEDQDVTAPGGSTALWNEEGESVTAGGSTGDQRTAAILLPGAATSVSVTWTGTEASEFFGVAALSFTEPLGRNLVTGTDHTVGGRDNFIAGRENVVNGSNCEAHGRDATVNAERSVLFALDGTPRTLPDDDTFEVYADNIRFNGAVLVNGSPVSSGGGGSVSAVDVERLGRAQLGLAVYSGCAVSEDGGGASMDVDVTAGHIRTPSGLGVLVTAGSVTLDTADATNDRIDLVWVNSSGTLGETAGTPAATPVPPSIPSNCVLLAIVSVPATDTTISNAQITDKRTYTRLPQFVRKTSNESVTSSVTPQDDNQLNVTIGASEVWALQYQFVLDATTAGDFRFTVAAPSGATGWLGGLRASDAITTSADEEVNLSVYEAVDAGSTRFIGGAGAGTVIGSPFQALVINSTTPGTATLQWAQSVSNGTASIVKSGSFVIATPLM